MVHGFQNLRSSAGVEAARNAGLAVVIALLADVCSDVRAVAGAAFAPLDPVGGHAA
jgi:hypothetical protein